MTAAADHLVALEAVQFNSALTPEDVWSPVTHHVDGLHVAATASIRREVQALQRSGASSPVGIALQGERGVGKTHMLRWIRQQVQADGPGFFFLIKLLDGDEFWRSAVHGVVDGFYAGQGDQLTALLRALAKRTKLAPLDESRIAGPVPLTREALDGLVAGLQRLDRQVWQDCQNTLRALVLYRDANVEVQEAGYGYLMLDGDVDEEARKQWGFRAGARSRQLVMRDLSRLFALVGPTVLAIDQIDPLFSHTADVTDAIGEAKRNQLVGEIADGLMELREVTRRTLSVVACLPASWELISRNTGIAVTDRFRTTTLQGAMPDDEVPRAIVSQHLAGLFGEIGYEPPHPTWPVAVDAFTDGSTRTLTPRKLLQRVDTHIRRCLDAGAAEEMMTFEEPPPPDQPQPDRNVERFAELDDRFARLRAEADVTTPLDKDGEDGRMPMLLAAGLGAYVAERGEAGQDFSIDQVQRKKPPLHARLRRTLHEQTEDEAHVSFRAIAHTHHKAVQSRLSAARTESGLLAGADRRALVFLRQGAWPKGPVTANAVAELEQMGARTVKVEEDDLRTFSALRAMQGLHLRGFTDWLTDRRPASGTSLFRSTLPSPDDVTAVDDGANVDTPEPDPDPHPAKPAIVVGRAMDGGHAVTVDLEGLRKHTSVFAGSGSGKTVLLRRLVEECALQGVSAIVLDPNNDLSRMGDSWPSPPPGWLPGDEERSREYLAHTDVVVWTPRRAKGRPLTFQPLPDFTPVLNEDDEFEAAVESAVASIAPRAGLTKAKLGQGTAVLKEAMQQYARDGGSTLQGFVELLEMLPEGISGLKNGPKLAADMAEHLTAAMINDPLFGGEGTPVDPSVLLTPAEGKRARISVISFVGLPNDTQRQSFVNQLQMALFSWVKKNPAGDRPLGGLFVMDEAQTFAPSGAFTACTQSSIALASQARKYGLGLVFATQAPKGIHNQITGNTSTQFFGFLNAPAQIAAAKGIAAEKQGDVDGISALRSGQFYTAAEGAAFERTAVPMCLSHHPKSPPTEEEVIERAARG